jgi:hypothetical protein
MPTQFRDAWPHHHLQMVGVTLGDEGRAVCPWATVQRPNVINENGDRPHVKHPAARDTYSKCGGRANHRTEHNEREQDPLGGRASRGQP